MSRCLVYGKIREGAGRVISRDRVRVGVVVVVVIEVVAGIVTVLVVVSRLG